MKQHSNEEIERARNWFQSQSFEQVEAAMRNGTKFSYFVMPQSLNPGLPHFVFQCANNGQGVFGISDSVPREFRKYAVAHEVFESGGINIRCYGALEKELTSLLNDQELKAPKDVRWQVDNVCWLFNRRREGILSPESARSVDTVTPYIQLRRDFFKKLIVYAQEKGYSDKEIQGFRGSFMYLNRILESLGNRKDEK